MTLYKFFNEFSYSWFQYPNASTYFVASLSNLQNQMKIIKTNQN